MTLIALRAFLARVPKEVWYALIALLLVFLAYRWAYNRGADAQAAKTAEVQAELTAALEANLTNQETIARLSQANNELANGREADKKAADKAVAALAIERDRLQTALDAAKRKRNRIYANNPEAAAVGATVVPDALVDSLRQ